MRASVPLLTVILRRESDILLARQRAKPAVIFLHGAGFDASTDFGT